jgi:hypothetical protein
MANDEEFRQFKINPMYPDEIVNKKINITKNSL